jgi:hypothetical protein
MKQQTELNLKINAQNYKRTLQHGIGSYFGSVSLFFFSSSATKRFSFFSICSS